MPRTVRLNKRLKAINIVFWAMTIVFVFKPGYAGEVQLLSTLFDYGRLFSILISGIVFIKYYKYFLKNQLQILLIAIKVYILFMSVVSKTRYADSLNSFLFVSSECLIVSFLFRKDIKRGLEAIQLAFEIIVYINFVTMILYPNGMYNFSYSNRIFTYIGHVNSTLYFVMPLLTVILLKQVTFSNRVISNRMILDAAICAGSIIMSKSATSYVAGFMFSIILFYEWKRNKIIKISLFKFYVIIIAMSVGIIFFNIQTHFSFLIEKLLNRSIDFTGRTIYWKATIQSIVQSPLFGHGAVPGELRRLGLGAHNFVLEILFEGGIVLLAIFSYFTYKLSSVLERNNKYRVSRIILSALCAMLITCISESNVGSDIFYFIFIFAININSIITISSDHKRVYGR